MSGRFRYAFTEAFKATRLPLLAGIVISVLAAIAFTVVLVPRMQAELLPPSTTSLERFAAENEARRTMLQALGGVVILLGLYLTYRRIAATERQVASMEQTTRIAQEGQVIERLGRAIDQLGQSDNVDVCLGGIYCLERLALDSARDHGPIVEILSAFVRRQGHQDHTSVDGEPSPEDKAPLLVQAALSAIGRCGSPKIATRSLNLDGVVARGVDLRGLNLAHATLRNADLRNSNLRGANLFRAELSSALLDKCDLRGADLEGATLKRTSLVGANLSGADLRRISVGRTTFRDADLSSADLRESFLWDVSFERANLQSIVLTRAAIQGHSRP